MYTGGKIPYLSKQQNFSALLFLIVLISACDKVEPERQVKMDSVSIIDTSTTTCVVEGGILDMGENSVLQVGFCWSTNNTPTINADHSVVGLRQKIGKFTDTIYSLWHDTEYFVRAFARNDEEVFYGDVKQFVTYGSSPAAVEIAPLTDITMTSAQCGGNVTDDGGTAVTARGVCWGLEEHPTVYDDKTEDGSGTGSFASSITGLTPNTTYYVRVYVTNASGTEYYDQWKFRTMKSILTDAEGNDYFTFEMGANEWMASNLNIHQYQNGDPIDYLTDGGEWSSTENGAYCYYDNNPIEYEDTYGALYNWLVVNDVRGICPDGWRVPEDTVWENLFASSESSDRIGSMLKESGFAHWKEPNHTGGGHQSGFTALPGGKRDPFGNFWELGEKSNIWTRTSIGSKARLIELRHDSDKAEFEDHELLSGRSIRCIKGEVPDTMSGSFVDSRDDREYEWIRLGHQVWMAENLAYLPEVVPADSSSITKPFYYVYNYQGWDVGSAKVSDNFAAYGVLYNWVAAKDACPEGWYLPGDSDFSDLEYYLGMSQQDVEDINMRGTNEGNMLKETGFEHWNSSNTGATNETGFTALPGGQVGDFAFRSLGEEANFWASYENGVDGAWMRKITSGDGGISRLATGKVEGYSVRCLRD